jgi:UDP-N-acetylglucosamine 3-dehydrogenase
MTQLQQHTDTRTPVIALVGCGAITEAGYIPALARHPEICKSMILIDTNLGRAQALADKIGCIRTATDHRSVIGSVDGAIIAAPHHFHAPLSIDFLSSGAHVLCEKPIGENSADVRLMIAAAAANCRTLSVNNTRRLIPSSVLVKTILDRGELGTVRSLEYFDGNEFKWPSASGFYFNRNISHKGVLLDIGAHALDLICWWLGGRPALVSSMNDSFGGIEAAADVVFHHDGCRGHVRLSRLAKLPNTCRIAGDDGTLLMPLYTASAITMKPANGAAVSIDVPLPKGYSVNPSETLVDNFIGVLQGTAAPLIPAESVLSSIEMIDEAYDRATQFPMPWYSTAESDIHVK